MAEHFELPETGEEHRDNPLILPVSITMSILAVLVAGATLLGHRAHTEELLRQSQATDQWAFYQAKRIRFHEMQGIADMLSTLSPIETTKASAMKEKYLKEVERYGSDSDDIREKAEELEKERDLAGRRADRFDGGEALLEIGLVICSITLLTKRRAFWIGGMLLAAGGVVQALTGLLLH
jgi:hypothetical protein